MFKHKEGVKNSILITWKYRLLWVFGFFVAEGFFVSNLDLSAEQKQAIKSFFVPTFWHNLKVIFHGQPAVVFWRQILILIFIALLFLFFSIIARSGILLALQDIKKKQSLKFIDICKRALPYFWHLLLLVFILSLGNVPGLLLLWLSVVVKTATLATWLKILGVIYLLVYNVLVLLFKHYAYCFLVFVKEKALFAIVRGWKMFVENWKISVIAQLVRLGSMIAVSLGLLLSAAICFIVFFVLGLLFGSFFGGTAFSVFLIIGIGVMLGLLLFINALFNTYIYTYLTKVYWYLAEEK